MKEHHGFGGLVLLTILTVAGCGTGELQSRLEEAQQQLAETQAALEALEMKEPGLIHSVFFWLKPGVSPEEAADFIQGCKGLGAIESVAALYAGPPAGTADRDVVDQSFGVALIVHFDDKAAHDVYQEHPIHQEFIDKYSHLWERVQVYDNRVD